MKSWFLAIPYFPDSVQTCALTFLIYVKFTFPMGTLWAHEVDLWRATQETLSFDCAEVPEIQPHLRWNTSESLGGEMQGLTFCKTQCAAQIENACYEVSRSFSVLLLLQFQTHSTMGHPFPLALRDSQKDKFISHPRDHWVPLPPHGVTIGEEGPRSADVELLGSSFIHLFSKEHEKQGLFLVKSLSLGNLKSLFTIIKFGGCSEFHD